MFGFFKKKYTVNMKHVRFKTLSKTFILNDKEDFLNFLDVAYNIDNYKCYITINPSDFETFEVCEIYNKNPYLEKVDLNNLIVDNSKDFLKRFDINNYEKPFLEINSQYDFEADYIIFLKDDYDNVIEECHIPDFEQLKKFLIDMEKNNINHIYTVNPNALTVKEYIEILNIYDKFKPFESFKNVKELNQYILDCRIIYSLEPIITKKTIQEIT